jgi:hypothetical protein
MNIVDSNIIGAENLQGGDYQKHSSNHIGGDTIINQQQNEPINNEMQ